MNPYESPQTDVKASCRCDCVECSRDRWMSSIALFFASLCLILGIALQFVGEWRYLNAGEAVQAGDHVNINHGSKDSPPHWEFVNGFVNYKTQPNDCRMFRRRR